MKKKVIVFAPHADDEALYLGGTICKYLSEGHEVKIVYFFPKDELEIVLNMFQTISKGNNFSYQVMFEEVLEGNIDTLNRRKLISFFDKILDSYKPDVAFIPYPNYHQDHVLMHELAISALRLSVDDSKKHFVPTVFRYAPDMSWGVKDFRPNFYIDISGVLDMKKEIVKSYSRQGQTYGSRLSNNIEGVAIHNGMQVNLQHAETFEVLRGRLEI